MFSQFKMYVYGVASLIVILLGLALWYQSGRIDRLTGDKAKLTEDVVKVVAANKTNVETIAELKKEREKIGKFCNKIVADKDKLINELRKIDEAKGGSDEIRTLHSALRNGFPDTVISLLNGMLPGQGGRPDGVCQAGDPAITGGAPLVSGNVLYCLDAVNAKNLLKDWALCQAARLEGVNIIEGLR